VVSGRLNHEGVVIDFKILKQKVEKVLKLLESHLSQRPPYFSGKEPSSENIAKYIFDKLKEELKGHPGILKRVTCMGVGNGFRDLFREISMNDIQNQRDHRRIEINKVGVKNIRYPITVLDKAKGVQHTVASVNMYVDLPIVLRAPT